MNRAVIAVGSNIEPQTNIEKAERILTDEQRMLAVSTFVKTKPRGFTEQADFLNGAFSIETELNQDQLIQYLKDVESRLGRIRTDNKNGPRAIDLDVVVFNGAIVDDDYNRYDFVRKAVDELSGSRPGSCPE